MDAPTTIAQFAKMLGNLDAWLAAGVAYAEAKSFSPGVLAEQRLAPDQFTLVQQVQSACDTAKFAAAYLSGQQAPSHPDTEKTLAEARARLQTARTYVTGIAAPAFAGWAERKVAPAWMQGRWMRGDEYLVEFAIPNFYFHVTTAYAILRHNGVAVGKRDYLGTMTIRDA